LPKGLSSQQAAALLHKALKFGEPRVWKRRNVTEDDHLVRIQRRGGQAVRKNHRRQKKRRILLAHRVERPAEKKSFALRQRRLRIAVDDENLELVLSVEREVCRGISRQPSF
jgi:hypothetical protein